MHPIHSRAPVVANFRLPGDRSSQGLELDLTWNPTREWRIFANAGRTDTEIDDLSTQPWWDYLDAKLATWRTFGGNWSTTPYDNTRTVEEAWNAFILNPVEDVRASLGNAANNSQTWRSNLVATHSFTEGRLKGATASVNFRYRGPSIVGFPNKIDDRGRTRVDRDKPYYSERYIITGLMANYRFRAFAGSSCRVQLNVNNVFNTNRVFVTRVFANGVPRNYGRQAGREFILSMDIER